VYYIDEQIRDDYVYLGSGFFSIPDLVFWIQQQQKIWENNKLFIFEQALKTI
jgi:hypothetical protein